MDRDFREITNALYIPDSVSYRLIYKDGTTEDKSINALSRDEFFMAQYYSIISRLNSLKEIVFSGVSLVKRLDLIVDVGDEADCLKDVDITKLIKALGGHIGNN